MNIITSGLLLVSSVVFLECTYGVSSQRMQDVDSLEMTWGSDRRPNNEQLLQNIAEYLASQARRGDFTKADQDFVPVPQDAPSIPRKRACFNVLDACCMFNLKGCDRFNKKRVKSRMQ